MIENPSATAVVKAVTGSNEIDYTLGAKSARLYYDSAADAYVHFDVGGSSMFQMDASTLMFGTKPAIAASVGGALSIPTSNYDLVTKAYCDKWASALSSVGTLVTVSAPASNTSYTCPHNLSASMDILNITVTLVLPTTTAIGGGWAGGDRIVAPGAGYTLYFVDANNVAIVFGSNATILAKDASTTLTVAWSSFDSVLVKFEFVNGNGVASTNATVI